MLVATIITLLQPDIYVLRTVTAVSTRFLAMYNNCRPTDARYHVHVRTCLHANNSYFGNCQCVSEQIIYD